MVAGVWFPSWIGIGANLDDPVAQVRWALKALGALPDTRLVAKSSLYRNPPMGPADQPDYVNAVAAVLTRLDARNLLDALHDLERERGRERRGERHWGPRCLDLDLLTYGLQSISAEGMNIPHPGISQRNFVLCPLLEVAPRLHIPGQGLVWKLAAAVDAGNLEKIE